MQAPGRRATLCPAAFPSPMKKAPLPYSGTCGLGGLTWRSCDLGLANQHILFPEPQGWSGMGM